VSRDWSDQMKDYTGTHARFYDAFYANKPYREEAEFVHQLLSHFGSPPVRSVLELACGTGSHAVHLAELGYVVTGIDRSEELIEQARRKTTGAGGERLTFHLGDMRDLRLEKASIDAATCLFDSLGYLLTNDAIGRLMAELREALAPNGLFIFEFWHAAAMLRRFEPVRVRRVRVDGREVLRLSETSIDHFRQLAEVRYTIFTYDERDLWAAHSEVQRNRFFSVPEMELLLRQNGFLPVKWYGGFSWEESIDDRTWHVLAVARRR
jgi:SAM-dependent methyltransferase